MSEKKIKTGKCPGCKNPIAYEEGTTDPIRCEYCDREVYPADLSVVGTTQSIESTQNTLVNLMASIDNADSALAYLENFFENYNWEEFCNTTLLSVPEVDSMVATNLVKSASNPATWELQFKSIAIPLLKKIEGLKVLEEKFLEAYKTEDDLTLSLEYFDTYAKISAKIESEKTAILKKMQSAIDFATKYESKSPIGAKTSSASDLKIMLETEIKTALEGVKKVTEYKQLNGYQKASEEKQALYAKKLAQEGIDAENLYREAVSDFNSGMKTREVVSKFKQLKGYKDASDYKKELDAWLRFGTNGQELIKLGSKFYILRAKQNATFAVKEQKTFSKKLFESVFKNSIKKKEAKNRAKELRKQQKLDSQKTSTVDSVMQDQENQQLNTMRRLELVEINNGIPAEVSVANEITQLLAHYGTYLFFIKNNKVLCSFDSETNRVEVILSAKVKSFESINSNEVYTHYVGNYLFLKKKLEGTVNTAKGCAKKLFGKKDTFVAPSNNYALIRLNLSDSTIETAIPELIDVIDTHKNQIFFSQNVLNEEYAEKNTKKGKNNNTEDNADKYKKEICVYDVNTNESHKILDHDTEFVDVLDGKVVYLTWEPNRYNKNLCTLDLVSGETAILEKNVYGYFKTVNGKIYYTVGNNYSRSLLSINPDGTGRTEIYLHAENLSANTTSVINNWLYVQKGNSLNSVLIKISADGKERIPVCTQFKKLITIKDGYIYYKNTSNDLCVVRVDGNDRKVLVEDVTVVSVDDNYIYFTRNEYVGEVKNNTGKAVAMPGKKVYNNSLYRVNLEGHEITKLAFDVNAIVCNKYDKNELYISKNEIITYQIKTPVSKKKYETEYKCVSVSEYVKYNKKENSFDTIVSIGIPKADHITLSGCFKKKTDMEKIVTVVPNRIEYERDNVAESGAVGKEENKNFVAAQNKATKENAKRKADKKANRKGCNGCKPGKK